MSTIKKPFQALISLMEANKEAKVSEILDQVIAMCTSQKRESSSWKDENGEVKIIFCYYHKRWEIVGEHIYGAKRHSITGLNSMCKIGVNAWTKRQKLAKDAESKMLTQVAKHEVKPEEIPELMIAIELAKIEVIPQDEIVSYAVLDEAIEMYQLQVNEEL